MAEHKSKLESVREWVVQNKLRTVGNFLFFFGFNEDLKFIYLYYYYYGDANIVDFCDKREFVALRDCGFHRLQLVSTRYENKCQDHSR